MPRKKRIRNQRTPLEVFLKSLKEKRGMSLKETARIAGCAPSTVHSWSTGALPCESVIHLKRLCDQVGASLAFALTGEEQNIHHQGPRLETAFLEQPTFEGYVKIFITKIISKESHDQSSKASRK